IHRDIKPENIIRKPGGQLVLVDFGAAKYAAGLTLTKTGTVIGSAEYSAPEQAGGKATFASDLYSLGVTCLVLLTCTSPFELYSYADMGWKWQQYLRGQSISTELTEVLNRLVAPGLNYRFQTADQVLEALSHPSKPPSGPILPDQPYQPAHSILHLQRFQFHVIWVNHYGREINRELKETGYFIESFPGFHMEMVGIPEGTLAFPIDGGNHGQSSQGIMLAPFYMGKYPIHQGQWRTVAALPRINQELPPNPSYFRGEKRPVESISWFEAV
ncbi:MAG: protein kinase domain-containing protein, partial [Synechococcales cyanobacterium]